jgi:hypothetical protein
MRWKLTDGRGSLVPASYGQWPGHHITRAIAWLMAVGNGMWVVRYRNRSSRPMKLPAAKKYAVELVKGIRRGETITDPIKHLNAMAAALVGANNDWLPPVEPDLVEYIRCVETGWGGAHGG